MIRDTLLHSAASIGFTNAANIYDQGRLDFPKEAIREFLAMLNLPFKATILELGAGTGRFSKHLIPHFETIIAVEPLEKMRQQFVARLPQLDLRAGSAEAIPLERATANGVVCVDAFHWFAVEPAVREIHRVLKQDGKLALVWSTWDRSDSFVSELMDIIASFSQTTPSYAPGDWQQIFQQTSFFAKHAERQKFYPRTVTAKQVINRIMSVSFIATLPQEAQAIVRQKVVNFVTRNGLTHGRSRQIRTRIDIYVFSRQNH